MEIVVWVVLLIAAVLLIGFFLNRGSWRSIRENYGSLSEKYGLELSQPEPKGFGLFQASPSLYGKWEGREMSVQTVAAGLKDSRHSETAVHLQTALRGDCILLIRSKKGLNRLERSEFKKLIKVNGPSDEFNKRIGITSNRPDWVSEKITASMCERILSDLGSTTGTILLVKGRMSYRELGVLSGAGTLERVNRMIALLKWLTDSLEDGEPESAPEIS
ncbi:MAG: hypothetical protein ACQKBT_04775 [Puniceicoccales bacterium]